jgi:hypothetical protein
MKKVIYSQQDKLPSELIGHLYFEIDLGEGKDHKEIEVVTDEDGIIKEAHEAG